MEIREYERNWFKTEILMWGDEEKDRLLKVYHNSKARLEPQKSLVLKKRRASAASLGDDYQVVFNVPGNPDHLFLNLDSTKTLERQFKLKLLLRGGIEKSSTVAYRMGGVGKTRIWRASGHYPETRFRFDGGIFHMSIGQCAGIARLIEVVADAVKEPGGGNTARIIEKKNSRIRVE